MKLDQVADVRTGHQFQGRGAATSATGADGFSIQINNIDKYHGVDWRSVNQTRIPGRTPYFLQDGDIIFYAKGEDNYAIALSDVPTRTVACSHLMVIRLTSTAFKPEFVAWQINQGPIQQFLALNRGGDKKKHVAVGTLKRVEVVDLGIDVQQKIVELDHHTRKEIEIYKAMITNRERYLKGVGQKFLTSNTVVSTT